MFRVFVNDETVPVDEYEDVVEILNENDVQYYERPRLIGSLFRFGSTGAGCDIIVNSEIEYQKARQLIDTYQQTRMQNSRADFAARKTHDRHRELFGWLLTFIVITVVLVLSIGIGF